MSTVAAELPDYDVVVATRNRLDMLKLSLPLFLSQTHLPKRLILIDASDDHPAVAAYCAGLAGVSSVEIVVEEGRQRNLPAQRNQGVALTGEDIIALPDDDSLWHRQTAERLMVPYMQDTEGRIGCVSGIEVSVNPIGGAAEGPKRTRFANLKRMIVPLRYALERAFLPEPAIVYGNTRIRDLRGGLPGNGKGFTLVPTVAGFRMSFRRALLEAQSFDETFGYAIGYATYEDYDFIMRMLQGGWLCAAAPGADVYHNVYPAKRAAGFAYGFFHILNYMMACAKVFEPRSAAQRTVPRYVRYKLFLYGLRKHSEYHRDIARGARVAAGEIRELFAAKPEARERVYREICDRHAKEHKQP